MYLNPAPFVWITTSGIEPNPPVHETDMQTFTLCRTFILFFYSYNILFWIRTKIDTLEELCSTIELRELKVKLRLTNKKRFDLITCFTSCCLTIRVIRFELMISTWKVEAIPT